MIDAIDPLLLLAHAVYTSPGVHAVLIGSGASSAAGVPTGWAITLDLIERMARLEGADTKGDPEKWYRTRFGAAPDYSELLSHLGATPAERQAIVRSYIEPTDQERSEGVKLPTNAHRALARLAANGSVRMIVTTNFDRLIEQTLTESGVDFDVIANVDSLAGALEPLPANAHGNETGLSRRLLIDGRARNAAWTSVDRLTDVERRKLLDARPFITRIDAWYVEHVVGSNRAIPRVNEDFAGPSRRGVPDIANRYSSAAAFTVGARDLAQNGAFKEALRCF